MAARCGSSWAMTVTGFRSGAATITGRWRKAAIGPASLRDRAASLGGTLMIESEGSGSRVEIALPLAAAEAV